MRKMSEKIALFVPSLGGGGAERVMVLLANGLAKEGFEVDFIVVNSDGVNSSSLSEKVNLINFEKSRVIKSLPIFIKYLKQENPRVLISALDYANVIALLARKISRSTTKIIVTEHSTLSAANQKDFNLQTRILHFLMKLTYPGADQVLAVSQGVADDLADVLSLDRSKVGVAYNPVVTDELKELSAEKAQWPWERYEGSPFVLATGRLVAAKDFSNLLNAFEILKKKIPAKLVILGEGEERGLLEDIITQKALTKDVVLQGFVKNPYAWMASADLFVMSSRWEGLPTALIEAMACGVPVISTDCPSGPKEILEDGKWGKLVPVGNSAALAEAMEAAILNPEKILVEKRAQNFSVRNSVLRYIEFVNKL